MRIRLAGLRWGMALAVAGMLAVSNSAQAGFDGFYAPENWTEDTSSNGFVDVSNAPDSITVVGPDDGSELFGWTDYFIVLPYSGTLSFDWLYESDDDPGFDTGYYISGGFVFLSDTSGEFGTVTIDVVAGDIFGFSVETGDGLFGPGYLTISSFAAPVPEPSSLALVGLGAASLGAMLVRKRRKAPAATGDVG